MNPLQPAWMVDRSTNTNAFVTKLNPSGSALVYSTYLGGSGQTGRRHRHRRRQLGQRLRHRVHRLNQLSHDESLAANLWRRHPTMPS